MNICSCLYVIEQKEIKLALGVPCVVIPVALRMSQRTIVFSKAVEAIVE